MEKVIETAKQEIEKLSKCTCCERHQTRRPNKLETYTFTVKPYYEKFECVDCKCSCRHEIRRICSLFTY